MAHITAITGTRPLLVSLSTLRHINETRRNERHPAVPWQILRALRTTSAITSILAPAYLRTCSCILEATFTVSIRGALRPALVLHSRRLRFRLPALLLPTPLRRRTRSAPCTRRHRFGRRRRRPLATESSQLLQMEPLQLAQCARNIPRLANPRRFLRIHTQAINPTLLPKRHSPVLEPAGQCVFERLLVGRFVHGIPEVGVGHVLVAVHVALGSRAEAAYVVMGDAVRGRAEVEIHHIIFLVVGFWEAFGVGWAGAFAGYVGVVVLFVYGFAGYEMGS